MSLIQKYNETFEIVVNENVAKIIEGLESLPNESMVLGQCIFEVPSKHVMEEVLRILGEKKVLDGIRFTGEKIPYWNSRAKIMASWSLTYRD